MNKLSKGRFSLAGRPLIMGTFILTATGLVTRTIGFFYRIYLSRLFGEEGMGIYQLITPVLSLSFSLCAAAYQTAISKFVAECTANRKNSPFRPLASGLCIALPLSLLCCFAVYTGAGFISARLLLEPRTESLLRILAFSIPLSSVHSCINGYFYGIKKTGPAAAAQLLEQLARVGCVYAVSARLMASEKAPSINVAVLGLTAGELVSMLVSLTAIWHALNQAKTAKAGSEPLPPTHAHPSGNIGAILSMALPLTLNRIVLNLLQSVESVSIPARLRLYGYDNSTALSVYGVLTGMAMPLIFFPNALTNSVSVLLLPLISENYAVGNMQAVKSAVLRTVKFCFILGFICMSGFFLTGGWIGSSFFDSPLAGHFIVTLSFLCPFLYLDATLSSILQGLGKAGTIFVMNVLALLIRLGFVFLAIPLCGITGYLWGILVSQIVLSLLYLICLRHFLRRNMHAV